jgi:hypothetical protein
MRINKTALMNSIDFITNFENNTVAHALYLHKCRIE